MVGQKCSLRELDARTGRPRSPGTAKRSGSITHAISSSLDRQFEVLFQKRNRQRANTLRSLERRVLGLPKATKLVQSKAYDHGGAIAFGNDPAERSDPGAPELNVTWQATRQLLWDNIEPDIASFSVEPFSEEASQPENRPGGRTDAIGPKDLQPRDLFRGVPPASEVPAAKSAAVAGAETDAEIEEQIRQITSPGATSRAGLQSANKADAAPVFQDSDQPPRSEAAPAPEPAKQDPNAIFERMGRNMQLANTFSLGGLEIDKLFESFEEELDAEDGNRQALAQAGDFAADLDIDDVDLIAELSQLSDSLSKPDEVHEEPGRETAQQAGQYRAEPRLQTDSDEAFATRESKAEPTDQTQASPKSRATMAVSHEVPMVPARPEFSPAEASAAMIVAWHDGHPTNLEDILAGKGPWAHYRGEPGLANQALLDAWSLRRHPAQSPPAEILVQLLREKGPLWIGSDGGDQAARVMTGINFDSGRRSWTVSINDPLGQGETAPGPETVGSQYTQTYEELLEGRPGQARASHAVVVAHR